ncbi:MAG: hypothetical protein RLZZ127_1581, partial [Planctomycetota bacterium]
PLFKNSTIRLGNGKTFTIEADQVGDTFLYIASATLNGKPYDRSWIRHAQIADGGTLSLRLTDTPTSWGTSDVPPSVSTDAKAMYIAPMPENDTGSGK